MPDRQYELIVVGGGLSSVAVLYNLIENLNSHITTSGPLSILVLEKTGNIWTGVPYGRHAEKDFFLIDTLAKTKAPIFEDWLLKKGIGLTDYFPDNNPTLNHWLKENSDALKAGKIHDLFFPRFIFGIFLQELMEGVLGDAQAKGSVSVEISEDEVINIDRLPTGRYFLETKGERRFETPNVVLAIGSIPKRSAFNSHKCAERFNGYIDDAKVSACFELKSNLEEYVAFLDKDKVEISIIGSAASAVEMLFYIGKNENICKKISRINVISTSGWLIGGIHSEDFDYAGVPEYVFLRTSSSVYLNTIGALYSAGLLKVIKGKVSDIEQSEGKFSVRISNKLKNEENVMSDVIINCTGSGDLENANSTLLQNIRSKFPINREGRGFKTNDDNQVERYPGLFVVGPLLNSSFSGRQVESIAAVFTEGTKVSKALIKILGKTKNDEVQTTAIAG